MLRFHTSQYRYAGPTRLDVTAQGQDPLGRHFAPTWALVRAWKAKTIDNAQYTHAYYELMRLRFRGNRQPWNELLGKTEVVLVCFETPEEQFCHRYVLANILQKLGSIYVGELNADGSSWGMVDLSRFEDCPTTWIPQFQTSDVIL